MTAKYVGLLSAFKRWGKETLKGVHIIKLCSKLEKISK